MDVVWLKPHEVGARLGVSSGRVYQLMRIGVLPFVRQGRALRIPAAAFQEWVDGQSAAALASLRPQGGPEEAAPATVGGRD